MSVADRFKNAWNVFKKQDEDNFRVIKDHGPSVYYPQTRRRYSYINDKNFVSSIYTRISMDAAAASIRHVKIDENNRYIDDVSSGLNECLTFQPNIDQGPRAFRQDLIQTLFDTGSAAIVPVDTSVDPETSSRIDIYSLRVGEIVEFFPKHVRVNVYNERSGIRENVILEKENVAIIQNPLYGIVNEPNSITQRLIRKLQLLDAVDEQSGSGRLDIIIQLPYTVKREAQRERAEARRKDIEFQLQDSKYGIAYADATEKITQLNRPAENNLFNQVEYLVNLLYTQLGLTEEILNGTAQESVMLNYRSRTLEPILDAITEGMIIAFLGILGVRRHETIQYFLDPFKLVPLGEISEMADKFTRNEILTSNEVRGIVGLKPSNDPKADELRNANMPMPEENEEVVKPSEGDNQNEK